MAEADLRGADRGMKNGTIGVARAQPNRPLRIGFRLLVAAERKFDMRARLIEVEVIRINRESGVDDAKGFVEAVRQAQIIGLYEVRPDIVGVETDSSIDLPQHFGFVVGPRVAQPKVIVMEVGIGAACQSLSVVWVNLERAVEQGPGLIDSLVMFFRGLLN